MSTITRSSGVAIEASFEVVSFVSASDQQDGQEPTSGGATECGVDSLRHVIRS